VKRILALPFVLFLVIGWFGSNRAQAQDPAAAVASPSPEIMQKDDRLPFMASADESAKSTSEPGSGMLLIKSLGAMVLVLGLIFFGAWGARKLGFGTTRTVDGEVPIGLKIESTVAVGSGRTIAAVSFAGRILLVGSTANSFTLLAEEEKTQQDSSFQPRSVAEMLRDERSFGRQFDEALANEDS